MGSANQSGRLEKRINPIIGFRENGIPIRRHPILHVSEFFTDKTEEQTDVFIDVYNDKDLADQLLGLISSLTFSCRVIFHCHLSTVHCEQQPKLCVELG